MLFKLAVRGFCGNRIFIYSDKGSPLLLRKIIGLRSCSTQQPSKSDKQSKLSTDDGSSQIPKEFMPEEVIDKIQSVRSLDVTSKVKLRPVESLGIKPEVLRVKKNGSFIKTLFISKFDTDFLAYPEILKTRKEFDEIQKQCEMIETYFHNFINDSDALHKLKFDSLWKMTVTEMMTVFESIGHTLAIRFNDCFTKNVCIQISVKLLGLN